MFGIVSSVDWPEIIIDIVISLAGYAISRWPDWYGLIILPDIYAFVRIRFKQIIVIIQKSMWILFTDTALPTITYIDRWFGGGGGGGGGGYCHTDQNNGSMHVYFII